MASCIASARSHVVIDAIVSLFSVFECSSRECMPHLRCKANCVRFSSVLEGGLNGRLRIICSTTQEWQVVAHALNGNCICCDGRVKAQKLTCSRYGPKCVKNNAIKPSTKVHTPYFEHDAQAGAHYDGVCCVYFAENSFRAPFRHSSLAAQHKNHELNSRRRCRTGERDCFAFRLPLLSFNYHPFAGFCLPTECQLRPMTTVGRISEKSRCEYFVFIGRADR